MAPSTRVKAAFQAMKEIGIPDQKTKPALKKLLKLYDKNWELIEAENYRVLADAIFEYEDTEAAEKEKKKAPPSTDQGGCLEEETRMQDEPERPLKRLRLKHQSQAATSSGQPSTSSGHLVLLTPKPEPGEPEIPNSEQAQPMAGSQSNAANRRAETLPVSPQSVVRNKGKQPMSPQNIGAKDLSTSNGTRTDKRAAPGRASQALKIKEPNEEQRVNTGKQKQKQIGTIALITPKPEPFTDDMLSLEPLAVVIPEHSHPEIHSKSTNQSSRQDGQCPGASPSVNEIGKPGGTVASPTTEEKHSKKADVHALAPSNIDMAASSLGDVRICLSCNPGPNSRELHVPDLQVVLKKVEENCIKTYKIMSPEFTVNKLMMELCDCVVELGTSDEGVTKEGTGHENASVVDNAGNSSFPSLNGSANADFSVKVTAPTDSTVIEASNPVSASNCQQMCLLADKSATGNHCTESDTNSVVDTNAKSIVVVQEQQQLDPGDMRWLSDTNDITRGEEEIKVSLERSNCEFLPAFHYIAKNVVSHNADVIFSLSQIGNQDCCVSCHGECLSLGQPCNCAQRNGGESPYTSDGLVREELLEECISMVRNPQKHNLMFCKECPLERLKNEDMPDPCKGHLRRKFIKECWTNCSCSKTCGNRVVQRGIRCNLQVFWTLDGKGWGLRTLEDLPKGTFVCEYVGEILTTTELHKRNLKSNDKHSYSVLLDTDWGSKALKKDQVLCLDSTHYGNVSRFINHRCSDANLIEIPVEAETPHHHYYHVALFTTRKIDAFEELTWDYGVDFDDNEHYIKAFRCLCGSKFCRNMKRTSRSRSALTIR